MPVIYNIKMRPVCKIFCLFSCAYELYYSKELLVAVKLLLLLQHKHEVVPKTALHHHPVHSTWGAGKYPSLGGFTEGGWKGNLKWSWKYYQADWCRWPGRQYLRLAGSWYFCALASSVPSPEMVREWRLRKRWQGLSPVQGCPATYS